MKKLLEVEQPLDGAKAIERHASKLNELVVPAVNTSYCIVSAPKLSFIFSIGSFCAGYKDEEKGTCIGDSGSGFYMLDSSTDAWNVRGIISGSLIDQNHRCDINNFQLFTNVARFIDWIEEITKL
jgi:secreted trypsin-like serine protease